MPSRRALRLRKETLIDLSPDALAGVGGGQEVNTLPVDRCISRLFMTCTCCTATASCSPEAGA